MRIIYFCFGSANQNHPDTPPFQHSFQHFWRQNHAEATQFKPTFVIFLNRRQNAFTRVSSRGATNSFSGLPFSFEPKFGKLLKFIQKTIKNTIQKTQKGPPLSFQKLIDQKMPFPQPHATGAEVQNYVLPKKFAPRKTNREFNHIDALESRMRRIKPGNSIHLGPIMKNMILNSAPVACGCGNDIF